jgi:hypothetical protein
MRFLDRKSKNRGGGTAPPRMHARVRAVVDFGRFAIC